MVVFNDYECDNRVRRYAEALAERGDHVDVIALAPNRNSSRMAELNGVTVWRIHHRERNERNKWIYAWRWLLFFLSSAYLLTRRHHQVRYDVIHVHNMPDFLVWAAWYPKLTGAGIILDIHDVMPELHQSKFGTSKDSLAVRLLKLIEKKAAGFADHVIVSNQLWCEKLIARSAPKEKCSALVNHVDRRIFCRRPRTRSDSRFVILYPGSFQWHQGLNIAIDAFRRIAEKVPNAELHLYGNGDAKTALVRQAEELGLSGRVRFFEGRSLDKIVDVIANADLGVVPKIANSFGNEAYSTKIMEFMSLGVPVIASRTAIDTFYFNDSILRFFESGNSVALADAMLDLIEHPETREVLVRNALAYVERNDWSSKQKEYLALVDRLSKRCAPSDAPGSDSDSSKVSDGAASESNSQTRVTVGSNF